MLMLNPSIKDLDLFCYYDLNVKKNNYYILNELTFVGINISPCFIQSTSGFLLNFKNFSIELWENKEDDISSLLNLYNLHIGLIYMQGVLLNLEYDELNDIFVANPLKDLINIMDFIIRDVTGIVTLKLNI